MGDRVRAFECAFADAHHAMDAVAVNSCTAGLHRRLKRLGWGQATKCWLVAVVSSDDLAHQHLVAGL